jgi:methanol metabolism-related c-type cytochrome
MGFRRSSVSVLAFSAAAAVLLFAGSVTPVRADDPPPYKIVNGKVDIHVFNGYRRYGDSCMRCHGPDGAGSSYAPNLTQSLKRLSHDQFEETVINGKQDVSNSSDKVMPAFGTVPDVVNYLEDIYGYLKARSDGVIGRGRPDRYDDN